ncbi:MAG: hypothetical protein HY298_07835 [Verrucomicrobia bacterium]|nr:hypothetical protein [Verrucomicrobiota bacterium]
MKTSTIRPTHLMLLALPLFINQLAGADYPSSVLSDNPVTYHRFNDDTSRSNINKNSGSLGAAGDLTNTFNVKAIPGALAGSGNRAQFFLDGNSYGMIPFNAAVNPDNTKPFTIEVWFYPASDQINGGECPINNRVSSGFPDRTGWVFFQRAQNLDYSGHGGYEGVGWNCRMYRGIGGASGLDVVSQVPMSIGTWQHVVVVYDPIDPVTNASLTIYINGVAANTNIWTGGGSGTDPGYTANPPVTEAALSLGAYNNTSGAGANPYFGGIDEFAFYSNKLSPAQILAHYQNGTNANRATPYEALIQSANPVVYLRLDELPPGPDVAINMGDVRNSGIATHTAEVRHPAASALAGRTDDGAAAYHNRNGRSTTTIPYLDANNPNAGIPFTFETWIRPMRDQQGGQCPVNNRFVGGTGRTGWVIFQRFPNASYASVPGINNEGHGWNFRMYGGVGGSGGSEDLKTEADYTIGKWQHLVFTWEPQTDNGDPGGNGNNQWQGILTAYVDGIPVKTNTPIYAANVNPPEDASVPADLGIGSYNAKSGLGDNPFEGDIDELVIYTNYVLTADQVLAHYQAGTNTHPATNYETLVLTAPYLGAGDQRQGPPTYLRFNDPARFPAANSGPLGYLGDGNLDLTTNIAAGPQSPTYAGFEASNTALPLDGIKQWSSLNNPSGLNFSGQVSLEAWINPTATKGATARIISHGPPTITDYLTTPPDAPADGSVTNSSQVFLRIDTDTVALTTNYVVGYTTITYTNNTDISSNFYGTSFAVPAGDLGGANGWIHLVGTYDGANWKLFRNGVQVASAAGAVGALPISNGDWAIGSTGNGWADNFAGGIDEVAIYDPPLTLARIWAHYYLAIHGRAAFNPSITRPGGVTTVSWPAGTLQHADNVTGPWTDLVGALPPGPTTYNPPAGPTQKFYRVKL